METFVFPSLLCLLFLAVHDVAGDTRDIEAAVLDFPHTTPSYERTTPIYGTRRPPLPCYGDVVTVRPSITNPPLDYGEILDIISTGYYDIPEYNLTYQSDAYFYSVGYSEIDTYPPCPTDYDNGYGYDEYPYNAGYTGGDNN